MSRAACAAAAALLALGACAPKPIARPRPVPQYSLSMSFVAEDAAPKPLLGLSFSRRDFYFEAVAPRRGKAPCRISGKGDEGFAWYTFTHEGLATFPDGRKRVFLVSNDAGSGLDSVYLSLVDPARCVLAGLTIVTPHDAVHEQRLERWGLSQDAQERQFLDDMKYRFGYKGREQLDKEKDNPKFAYHFWARENGALEHGPLAVRKYKGRFEQQGSLEATLADERFEYAAEFKAGVTAYDRALDSSFVVFHPRDVYHWPTALAKVGDVLVIGTRGEGLALVDMKTLRLRRLGLGDDDDVRSLEAEGDKVRVNGKRLVALPRP